MTAGERSGTLSSEGFPYNYRPQSLECEINEVNLEASDGEVVGEDSVQIVESDRRVSLITATGWDEAEIKLTVSIPEKIFRATIPFDERDDPDLKLVLAVRAPQTILRMGEVGSTSSVSVDGDGEYELSATLAHSEVRGDVVLKPYLVRTEPQEEDENYATETAARLASDDAWTVRIDQSEEDGGFLRPLIEPFHKYPTFPGENHLHYLHFEDPSTPKLYLNADHGQLLNVMFKKGTRGSDARFRDVLYDYIEQSVWQELLIRTANDADSDTGETRHPWQDEVVELFAEDLYDDPDTPRDVAAQMASDAESGEDLDRLVSEIDRAIQKQVNHPDSALKLFQEGLHND